MPSMEGQSILACILVVINESKSWPKKKKKLIGKADKSRSLGSICM